MCCTHHQERLSCGAYLSMLVVIVAMTLGIATPAFANALMLTINDIGQVFNA